MPERKSKTRSQDYVLIEANWRVLHVRSNTMLPTREQIDHGISRLLAGEVPVVEIVLPDWGKGRVLGDVASGNNEYYPLFESLPADD